MKGYDYSTHTAFEDRLPVPGDAAKLAVICGAGEVGGLVELFGWDESTVQECTNLDEIVRYTSYDGYDFISIVHVEIGEGRLDQREINLFFGRHYLVLVLPEQAGKRLAGLREGLERKMTAATGRKTPLAYLYYFLFDSLASDFSDTLEGLEDEIEALSEAIENAPDKTQSTDIGRLRKTAYTMKKLLRALSYIGGQILVDENKLLDGGPARYFRNIDTRLIKLYGFADNLFDLSNELIHAYDSKLSAQMNETINKLTVITLFFGPMTLIAGIYGMNFIHMPELHWAFGYPAALGLMAAVSLAVYVILKKKKWL